VERAEPPTGKPGGLWEAEGEVGVLNQDANPFLTARLS
jgi:hypothetical protein